MSICPSYQREMAAVHRIEEPYWRTRSYDGGTYHTGDLRFCSYCGSLHPADAQRLVAAGATVQRTSKPHKVYIDGAPNLVAGRRVRVGSEGGPVWRVRQPRGLWERLTMATDMPERLGRATLRERLTGRYDRPTMGAAPAHLFLKLYGGH